MSPAEAQVMEKVRKALASIDAQETNPLSGVTRASLTLPLNAAQTRFLGLSAVLFGLRLIEIAAGALVG